MIEYLEKFKKLPADIKAKISSKESIGAISELEKIYGLNLASSVMKIMIGEADTSNLAGFLALEHALEQDRAKALAHGLENRVFAPVWDFLEIYKIRGIRDEDDPKRIEPLKKEVANTHKIDLRKTQELKKLPKKIDLSHLLGAPSLSDKRVVEKSPFAKTDPLVDKLKREISTDKAKILNLKKEIDKDIFFLDKDEKEVKEIADDIPLKKDYKENVEKKVEEIIKEAKISFSSNELKKRFRQILTTFLSGVRNRVSTKETMMREVAKGGLSLLDAQADKIVNLAHTKKDSVDNLKTSEEKKVTEKVNIKKTSEGANFIFSNEDILPKKDSKPIDLGKNTKDKIVTRDVDYDLKKSLEEGKVKLPPKKEDIDLPKSPFLKKEAVEKPRVEVKENKKSETFKKDSVLGNIKEEQKSPEIKTEVRTASPVSGKKRIEDIKTPKIMGPIDELLYMDLVAFRRMDANSEKRVKKIKAKIDLLQREGIDKMLEGVSAWRSSPVNKTYLQMGKESIEEERSIDKIIKTRKENGLNYLERDEFEAVMDLNRKLRF